MAEIQVTTEAVSDAEVTRLFDLIFKDEWPVDAIRIAATVRSFRERLDRCNHYNDDGDLVVERKTLFRQVGWRGQSGRFYSLASPPHSGQPSPEASFAPVYEQIAAWVEGEGWVD